MTDGSSVTTIQFYVGTNVDRALNDVKDQIAKIRTDLPRTIDEPIVSRLDIEGLPIVTYAASAPAMSVEDLSWFVDDTVARTLQGINGVGSVTRSGGVDREIRVSLDPKRLLALGVTAANVNAQLRATNVDLAGGRGEIAGQEQAIRTLAGAAASPTLRHSRSGLPGGRKVRLDDLGTVTDGAAEPRTFTRSTGSRSSPSASRAPRARATRRSKSSSQKKIAQIHEQHPEVEITKVDTRSTTRIGNYHSAMEKLDRGRGARGHRGVPLPARICAPRSSRRSRCRFRPSPPSGRWTCSASRSTS